MIKKLFVFILSAIMIGSVVMSFPKEVQAASLKVKSLTLNCSSYTTSGKRITMVAKAKGGKGKKKYKFLYKINNGKLHTIKNYSFSNKATLNLRYAGTYKIYVRVVDKRKKAVYKRRTIQVVHPLKCSFKASGRYTYETIKLSADSSGGTGTKQYKFAYKLNNGKLRTLKNYSTIKTASVKFTTAGKYKFYVYCKDKKNKLIIRTLSINVIKPPVLKLSARIDGENVDSKVKFKTTASGGLGTRSYKYSYVYKNKTYAIKNYSKYTAFSFIPRKAGDYKFIIECKDSGVYTKKTELNKTFTNPTTEDEDKEVVEKLEDTEETNNVDNQPIVDDQVEEDKNIDNSLKQDSLTEKNDSQQETTPPVSEDNQDEEDDDHILPLDSFDFTLTEQEYREKVVTIAKEWYGCKESDGSHKKIIDVYNSQKSLPRHYKVKYTDSWCATFVSACFIKAGLTSLTGTECSCGKYVEKLKELNSWVENDAYVPKLGDIIFYDWQDKSNYKTTDNKGWPDHVGIVYNVSNQNIKVIEGNYKDSVGYRNIKVNGRYIRGYGVPKYSKY